MLVVVNDRKIEVPVNHVFNLSHFVFVNMNERLSVDSIVTGITSELGKEQVYIPLNIKDYSCVANVVNNSVVVKCHKNIVPMLIGKGGSNVKKIMETHKLINVKFIDVEDGDELEQLKLH